MASTTMPRQGTFLLKRQPLALRLFGVTAALLILLVVAMLVAISSGSSRIPYDDVAQILLQPLGLSIDSAIPDSQITIVHQVRLPRILTAMLVGAGLAGAGAVMQGIFRNPLADPGILGVSAGGSFGAVLAFTTGLAMGGLWIVPIFAFMGGMVASLVVYLLSLDRGRTNVMSLLLAGIALNAFLSALISLLVLMTDDYSETLTILQWLIGGLAGRGWRHVTVIFIPILFGLAAIYAYSRDLNLLLLGEETAQGLGTNVARTRLILLAVSALLTSVAVSMVGPIGFVGLVVPHMLRLIIGPDYRVLLPASALGGAIFLMLADTVARMFMFNQEMPVGVVTGILGAPFFLYLLWRYRVAARQGSL